MTDRAEGGAERESANVDDQHVADLIEAEAGMIGAAARRLGPRGRAAGVAVLPYQNRPVLPAPAKRRRAFEARLDALIAAAFAEAPPRGEAGKRPGETRQGALLDAGCAACQGVCCGPGGEHHAFLGIEDIRRLRRLHPGVTAGEARAAYLGRLPRAAVVNACLFQSASGCTLPRRLRSDICNGFRCRGLKRLAKLAARGAAEAVLVTEFQGKAVATAVAADRDDADSAALSRPRSSGSGPPGD